MLAELEERVRRIEESLKRLVRIGVVTQVFEDKGTVRVMLPDADKEITYELPVLVRKTLKDKDYWLPDIGEHVLCVFLPIGEEQGFVIGAFYSKADKVPVSDKNKKVIEFEDGTKIEYNRKEHKLKIEVKGEADIEVEKDAKIEVKGNVEISANGKVVVSGKGTVEIDGGSGVSQKPVHDASPCPLFGVCHLCPSMTIKISP